jgi:hypothetical protein
MASFQIKGSHVVQARRWIDERLGEGTFRELLSSKDVELGTALILSGGWYDVQPVVDALTIAAERLNLSVEESTREIARVNALEDLTSIYRVFLRVAAPVRVMSFTPQLWSNYVAFGDATAIKNEPNLYLGRCTGIPESLLQWSCGAWRGFVPTAIELAGGKNVNGTIVRKWVEPGPARLYGIECQVRYTL